MKEPVHLQKYLEGTYLAEGHAVCGEKDPQGTKPGMIISADFLVTEVAFRVTCKICLRMLVDHCNKKLRGSNE